MVVRVHLTDLVWQQNTTKIYLANCGPVLVVLGNLSTRNHSYVANYVNVILTKFQCFPNSACFDARTMMEVFEKETLFETTVTVYCRLSSTWIWFKGKGWPGCPETITEDWLLLPYHMTLPCHQVDKIILLQKTFVSINARCCGMVRAVLPHTRESKRSQSVMSHFQCKVYKHNSPIKRAWLDKNCLNHMSFQPSKAAGISAGLLATKRIQLQVCWQELTETRVLRHLACAWNAVKFVNPIGLCKQ